jgi:hypothetical protein
MAKRFPVMGRMLTALVALSWTLTASADVSLAELDARYEQLVVAEQALLDQQEEIEARLADPELILVETLSGAIVASSRHEIERMLEGFGAQAEVLGIDEAILGSMSPMRRILVEMTGLGEIATADAMARLTIGSGNLRKRLASARGVIEGQLDDVRAQAEALQAERERLRAAIAAGTDPNLLQTRCLDPDAPFDRTAGIYTVTGGQAGYRVMGDQICRGRDNWGNYLVEVIMGEQIWRYTRIESDPDRCERVEDYAWAFERGQDGEGREQLYGPNASGTIVRVVFYPVE